MTGTDERCDLHGGFLPHPVDTCPYCAAGPAVGSGDGAGGGPPPLIEYDAEAIATAASNAVLTADGIEESVGARAAELATTTGSLRLVAALATAAAASAERAGLLAAEVSTMATNLGLTLDDYARVDDELALAFDSLLTV